MRSYLNLLGGVAVLLAVVADSFQDVHTGVDLVTRLSNNLVQAIFKEALAQKENVVASPFGLLSNMAMLLEASQDKTRDEFLQALNISSKDVADLRRGFKAYCELFLKYSSEPEAAGSFNSATLAASFKLNSTYKNVLQNFYCANVSESLGSNGTSLEVGSIAGVMSHWKDYEKLAVYTFLSHQSLMPFRKKDGKIVTVSMIPQVGVFRSRRWENCHLILLPLQASLVNLFVIVPDHMGEVESLVKKVVEESIPSLVQSLPRVEMEVFLPQMAVVTRDFNLTSLLVRSGVRRAFDGRRAELRGASAEASPVVVLRGIQQNSFFSASFNAVNSVSGITSSLEVHKRTKRDTKKTYLDRPFLFFILQKDTQLVLLAGKVENPAQVPA